MKPISLKKINHYNSQFKDDFIHGEYKSAINNIDNLIKELEAIKEELKQRVSIDYKDLKIGDIINYDLELRNKKLVNKTTLILDKNESHLKLHENRLVWYCTKQQFTQLKNVSVVESD